MSKRYNWFSREITSEKRAQKLRPNHASLPRSVWLRICFNQSEALLTSALISQTPFRGENSGRVARLRLSSQAIQTPHKTALHNERTK